MSTLKTRKLHNLFGWFFCAFMIAASGLPIVTENLAPEFLWPITIASLSGIWLLTRFPKVSKDVFIVIFFTTIVGIHTVVYGLVAAKASLGVVAMLTSVFLGLSLIDAFAERYVKIMAILASTSLVFFFADQVNIISASQFAWLPGSSRADGSVHAWLYHFSSLHLTRNSGPFWEPAAFAGYLIIALIFMTLAERTYSRWRIVVISLAIVTTFSTTGYLTVIPVIYLVVTRSNKKGWGFSKLAASIAAIAILVSAFVLSYSALPFMGDKVAKHYELTKYRAHRFEGTRFGALLYELEFVRKRPIVGWTPSEIPRSKVDSRFYEFYLHAGNGFAGFAAKFGIPALFFYLWRVNFAFRSSGASANEALLVVLIVTLLLQSEHFLNFPIFWSLAMLKIEPHLLGPGDASARPGQNQLTSH